MKLSLVLVSSILFSLWNIASSFSPSIATTNKAIKTQTFRRQRFFMTHNNKDENEKETGDKEWVEEVKNPQRRGLIYNAFGIGLLVASGVASAASASAPTGEFQRLATTQFIAALGDPSSTSGTGAKEWGLWPVDPGPRGVWLRQYEPQLVQRNNVAPAGWKFDKNDWWVEEHGLIMEAPSFPLEAGRYLVTGGRMVTTGLTIDSSGNWKLDEGSLFDVTHLPCRSARYHPTAGAGSGSPLTAKASDFPVAPGAIMPQVEGCEKQDYAVLFLIGKEKV
jgi:hypothetical protein